MRSEPLRGFGEFAPVRAVGELHWKRDCPAVGRNFPPENVGERAELFGFGGDFPAPNVEVERGRVQPLRPCRRLYLRGFADAEFLPAGGVFGARLRVGQNWRERENFGVGKLRRASFDFRAFEFCGVGGVGFHKQKRPRDAVFPDASKERVVALRIFSECAQRRQISVEFHVERKRNRRRGNQYCRRRAQFFCGQEVGRGEADFRFAARFCKRRERGEDEDARQRRHDDSDRSEKPYLREPAASRKADYHERERGSSRGDGDGFCVVGGGLRGVGVGNFFAPVQSVERVQGVVYAHPNRDRRESHRDCRDAPEHGLHRAERRRSSRKRGQHCESRERLSCERRKADCRDCRDGCRKAKRRVFCGNTRVFGGDAVSARVCDLRAEAAFDVGVERFDSRGKLRAFCGVGRVEISLRHDEEVFALFVRNSAARKSESAQSAACAFELFGGCRKRARGGFCENPRRAEMLRVCDVALEVGGAFAQFGGRRLFFKFGSVGFGESAGQKLQNVFQRFVEVEILRRADDGFYFGVLFQRGGEGVARLLRAVSRNVEKQRVRLSEVFCGADVRGYCGVGLRQEVVDVGVEVRPRNRRRRRYRERRECNRRRQAVSANRRYYFARRVHFFSASFPSVFFGSRSDAKNSFVFIAVNFSVSAKGL